MPYFTDAEAHDIIRATYEAAGSDDGAVAAALYDSEELAGLPHQDVLDFGRLAELLGYDRKVNTLDLVTEPRGYRTLGQVPRLPRLVVQKIVQNFGSVEEALRASDEELAAVDGVGPARAKEIREGVRRLQESVMADRFLNT